MLGQRLSVREENKAYLMKFVAGGTIRLKTRVWAMGSDDVICTLQEEALASRESMAKTQAKMREGSKNLPRDAGACNVRNERW